MAALVGGADQKHPHVLGGGRLDRRTIVLTDEVPVQVDVIEAAGVDRFKHQRQRRMGGEAHRADAALGLPTARHLQAASGAQGLFNVLGQIESVDRQQVDPLHCQALETQLQFGLKGGAVRLGRNLGLQDAPGIRHLGQQRTQLPLRGAVMARGFDVMEAAGHRLLQRGAQVGLAVLGDLGGGQIAPALLETHATQGEHGHRQVGATEAADGQHQCSPPPAWRGSVRRGRVWLGRPSGSSSRLRLCSSRSGSSS